MLSTTLLLNSAEAISIGDDPVAIIIFLAAMVSLVPSDLVTSTLFPAITFPLQVIGVTLLAAKSPPIPPVSFLTILSFLSIMTLKSSLTFSTLIPWVSRCPAAS